MNTKSAIKQLYIRKRGYKVQLVTKNYLCEYNKTHMLVFPDMKGGVYFTYLEYYNLL